jgi:phosphate transport system substrate-binding protein
MFQLWIKNFTQLYPSVQISAANTGSGTGQAFVEKGLVQICGSSAYLSDAQQALNPNILNIPLAVTADLMEYNIPGFPSSIHLNFTASLLSMIYNSTVTTWNDPRIVAINPEALACFQPIQSIPSIGAMPQGIHGCSHSTCRQTIRGGLRTLDMDSK